MTMPNSDLFIHESDYPDLNTTSAVAHLSGAIRFATVSYVDTGRIDYRPFDRLRAYLRESYPRVAASARWEEIGRSLLITLPGTDPSLKPALFMAHQDVVPVVKGTEGNWLHGPFSGDVCDGYIWGRGAMDIKQMLIGILESAEYLLGREEGRSPFRRTVCLAFGEDEETCSTGAMAIRETLKARGVTLEFVLDEGAGNVTDAEAYGAPGTLLCPIGICEKGYADLRVAATSRGGHSSNPFRGTSLGAVCRAVTDILDHLPPPRLSDSLRQAFMVLAPRITREPMRTWVRDMNAHEREILDWCLGKESLYYQVRTTAAPTMIEGGSQAGNVMPENVEAVINFRLIPGDTPESLLDCCKRAVGEEISLSWVQQIGASVPSDTQAPGFAALKGVLEHYFDRLVFIPALNRGATDARQYEEICRCVLRFGPFLEEEDVSAEGVHGTNERISVRAYLQGIRVLIRMMEETCL